MGHPTLKTLKLVAAGLLLFAVGCSTSVEMTPEPEPTVTTPPAQPESKVAEKPVDTRPEKVDASVPVRQRQSAIGKAYFNTREEFESYGHFEQPIDLYYALHGEYPKSHEEFIKKVWEPLKVPFPDIEEGYEYRYFPEDHRVHKVRIDAAGDDGAE